MYTYDDYNKSTIEYIVSQQFSRWQHILWCNANPHCQPFAQGWKPRWRAAHREPVTRWALIEEHVFSTQPWLLRFTIYSTTEILYSMRWYHICRLCGPLSESYSPKTSWIATLSQYLGLSEWAVWRSSSPAGAASFCESYSVCVRREKTILQKQAG